ncbi:MAG: hypothetical protein PHR26_03385, partial [Candidatus ainarchaeum sp.]|nr:hypothetical protein [Candidatus ainarchaeum sp.]
MKYKFFLIFFFILFFSINIFAYDSIFFKESYFYDEIISLSIDFNKIDINFLDLQKIDSVNLLILSNISKEIYFNKNLSLEELSSFNFYFTPSYDSDINISYTFFIDEKEIYYFSDTFSLKKNIYNYNFFLEDNLGNIFSYFNIDQNIYLSSNMGSLEDVNLYVSIYNFDNMYFSEKINSLPYIFSLSEEGVYFLDINYFINNMNFKKNLPFSIISNFDNSSISSDSSFSNIDTSIDFKNNILNFTSDSSNFNFKKLGFLLFIIVLIIYFLIPKNKIN